MGKQHRQAPQNLASITLGHGRKVLAQVFQIHAGRFATRGKTCHLVEPGGFVDLIKVSQRDRCRCSRHENTREKKPSSSPSAYFKPTRSDKQSTYFHATPSSSSCPVLIGGGNR